MTTVGYFFGIRVLKWSIILGNTKTSKLYIDALGKKIQHCTYMPSGVFFLLEKTFFYKGRWMWYDPGSPSENIDRLHFSLLW